MTTTILQSQNQSRRSLKYEHEQTTGSPKKMARVLENVLRKDGTPIETLLTNQRLLSVNQISAQIKLTEIWKATNIPKFPIKVIKKVKAQGARITRGVTAGKLIEEGFSNQMLKSFIGGATQLWNKAPLAITESTSIYTAKKDIKKFVVSLPI